MAGRDFLCGVSRYFHAPSCERTGYFWFAIANTEDCLFFSCRYRALLKVHQKVFRDGSGLGK
jgi:hypothetical protein